MNSRIPEDRDPLAAVTLPDGSSDAGDGDAEFEWSALNPITARLAPQAAYPRDALPDVLGAALDALVDLAAASVPTAAAALLSSLSVAVQADYDCQTLARKLKPTSLYFVALSESGWRKSSAYDSAFDPHVAADNRVAARWRSAKSDAGDPDFVADRKVRRTMPIALRSDATIEALLRRLDDGRPAQALASSEATAQLRNWSGQKTQRARTMSKLSDLWDGTPTGTDRITDGGIELRIAGRRVCVAWLLQPAVGLDWLFAPESADGFAGRSLIAQDDERPGRLLLNEAQEQEYESDLRGFTAVIARVRRRQDENGEFESDDDGADRAVARLDGDARELLNGYYAECESQSDRTRAAGDLHTAAFWSRAPEQAARLAANFAAFDWYLAQAQRAGDVVVNADTVARALELIDWYGAEWERLGAVAAATELAQAATAASAAIAAHGGAPKYRTKAGLLSLKKLLHDAPGAGRRQKGDPEFRQQVIGVLLTEGHIRYAPRERGGHGGFDVHPDLAAAWGGAL